MAGVPVSVIARRHDQRAKMRVFLWMLAVVVGVTLLTVVWAVGFPSAAAGATSRVQGWASPSRGVGGEEGGSGRGLLLTERERMHGIDGGGGGGARFPVRGGLDLPAEPFSPPGPGGGRAFADVELVSWTPRVAWYPNFLSGEECDHLIEKARKRLKDSTVVDDKTGESKKVVARSSMGMFLAQAEDAIVAGIEQRIADWTMIPVEHGEPLQVLKYLEGQEYRAHHDYFKDDVHVQRGGNRIATVLMYLVDVEGGGETVFPHAVFEGGQVRKVIGGVSGEEGDPSGACTSRGLVVHPKRGDAVLFWSTDFEGGFIEQSLHASCPVTSGEKWTSTRWIRMHPFK